MKGREKYNGSGSCGEPTRFCLQISTFIPPASSNVGCSWLRAKFFSRLERNNLPSDMPNSYGQLIFIDGTLQGVKNSASMLELELKGHPDSRAAHEIARVL